MHHYFEAITNNKGDALTGYYVRLVDSGGSGVTLYADTSLTPIVSVSGVADAAKVDANGNVDFYVAVGTYTLNIYATDSTTLVATIRDVGMNIDMDTAATAVAAQAAASASATAAASSAATALTAYTSIASTANATAHAATRAALALLGSSVGPVYLRESGREGDFVWSSSNLSANVTRDTRQGVYVAPTSDTTGASGAWVRKSSGPLHPKHFGAAGDGSADDGPALQAFFTLMTAERWAAGYSCDGYFKTAQALTIDGGTFGNDITFALNFGLCYIEATATVSRLLTIQDCHNSMFSGRCRLRGLGWASAGITNHTCDVGLLVSKVSQSMFGSFFMEGFNFAGLELDQGPTGGGYNNDSCHFLKVAGQWVGSGSATTNRSYTANWSARADTGSSNSSGQYSTITVDALPSAYACSNSISANVPDRQMLVEIAGQLCVVTYIDTGTNTLRVFPWINTSSGNSGTLKYHCGAGVVALGGDSSLEKFDQIDFNQSGCVAQFSALFGSEVGILHGENNGSFARFGKNYSNDFGTCKIGFGYAEGNTFRLVPVAANNYGIEIAALAGADTEAKDYDCSNTSNAGVLNSFAPGFIGFTAAAGGSSGNGRAGHHFKAKAFPIPYFNAGGAGETIDFNSPSTFRGPSFYNTSARSFTLVAPTATKKAKWGYDTAVVTMAGSGTGGAPNGSVTFIPPSGHTINGGAADATAVFTNSQFPGPVSFEIIQSTATDWLIYPVNPKSPAIQTVTSSGTVTPTAANDQVNITAQAANLTLANPSGTLISGKPLLIRIKDNGTGRTITYGTKYRAIGVTLPTTTVANKTHYLATRYNSEDDKVDVISVLQEA